MMKTVSKNPIVITTLMRRTVTVTIRQARHHHQHADVQKTRGGRLLPTLAPSFIIPSGQIIGGIISNSVALISDAMHNFSDFTGALISYVAFRIGEKGASARNTFGYQREEVMAP